MKNANQAPGLLRSRSFSFVFMLVTYCMLLLMPGWARGQTPMGKIVANTVSSQDHVENELNATAINGGYAAIKARAWSLGSYDGYLELQFPSVLLAGTTSYMRIDITDNNLLPGLLGGSLGKGLGELLGGGIVRNTLF